MRRFAVVSGALLLAVPSFADDVVLKDGRRFTDVRVTRSGDELTIESKHGSVSVPKSEVASYVARKLPEDELEARKAAAGDDPSKLRDVADFARAHGLADTPIRDRANAIEYARLSESLAEKKLVAGHDPLLLRGISTWCLQNGLDADGKDLLATARGIELEKKLEALADKKIVEPFVDLAVTLEGPERRAVLVEALACGPENPEVRRLLGQTKRDGQWISVEESERLDREAEVRAMRGRGLVLHDNRWMLPETLEAAREREGLDRARQRLEDEESRLAAERLLYDRAAREAADQKSSAQAELSRLSEARAQAEVAAQKLQVECDANEKAEARLAAERRASADQECRLATERAKFEAERKKLEDALDALRREREKR